LRRQTTKACQIFAKLLSVWLNSQKTLAEQGVDDTQGDIHAILGFLFLWLEVDFLWNVTDEHFSLVCRNCRFLTRLCAVIFCVAVLLKKKWFVSDASITEDDAVQLHLVYAQVQTMLRRCAASCVMLLLRVLGC
jgi:hypothetical protein